MPMMATMSPASAESISSRLSACIFTMRLKRSFLPVRWLKYMLALFDRALVDADERQLAERVVDDLERHADERLGRDRARAGRSSSGSFGFLAVTRRSSGEGR